MKRCLTCSAHPVSRASRSFNKLQKPHRSQSLLAAASILLKSLKDHLTSGSKLVALSIFPTTPLRLKPPRLSVNYICSRIELLTGNRYGIEYRARTERKEGKPVAGRENYHREQYGSRAGGRESSPSLNRPLSMRTGNWLGLRYFLRLRSVLQLGPNKFLGLPCHF